MAINSKDLIPSALAIGSKKPIDSVEDTVTENDGSVWLRTGLLETDLVEYPDAPRKFYPIDPDIAVSLATEASQSVSDDCSIPYSDGYVYYGLSTFYRFDINTGQQDLSWSANLGSGNIAVHNGKLYHYSESSDTISAYDITPTGVSSALAQVSAGTVVPSFFCANAEGVHWGFSTTQYRTYSEDLELLGHYYEYITNYGIGGYRIDNRLIAVTDLTVAGVIEVQVQTLGVEAVTSYYLNKPSDAPTLDSNYRTVAFQDGRIGILNVAGSYDQVLWIYNLPEAIGQTDEEFQAIKNTSSSHDRTRIGSPIYTRIK